MIPSGYVGFFDRQDIDEERLDNLEYLKEYESSQKKLEEAKIYYLKVLSDLEFDHLIIPSVMRELTPKGREVYQEYFSSAKENHSGVTLEENLDSLLTLVQSFSLSTYLPKREPCRYCEMDIFVYEMADQLWRTYFGDQKEGRWKEICERESYPYNYFPFLGAIEVMTKCLEKGWLEVNPPELKFPDRCTLKFVLPGYSELKKVGREGEKN